MVRSSAPLRAGTTLLAAFCLGACTGDIGSDREAAGGTRPGTADGVPSVTPDVVDTTTAGAPGADALNRTLADVAALGPSGVRRLSRREYADTVAALIGAPLPEPDVQALPGDAATPFDNDYGEQSSSDTLVAAVRTVAERAAKLALAEPARRAALVPCAPRGADDVACFTRFVETFGRRALRRPLAKDEIDGYVALAAHAVKARDFWVGVGLAVEAFLQETELLYRVEIGTPVKAGLVQLTDFEVVSRLSFLLWGTGPSDALLDAAAAGRLGSSAGVRAIAGDMLKDPRARGRLNRFFAMWLGYDVLPYEAKLAAAMRRETDALVERAVSGAASWMDLFTAAETFVDATLARHYGLAGGGATPGWVGYGASGRRGILSHGTFLSNGVKGGDTSPTGRGLNVRRRLLCQDIAPPPPELNVNADEPPDPMLAPCKRDRYRIHDSTPACAGCHAQMDDIGHGLENFDALGRYRATDEGKPQCAIAGEGQLAGVGTFKGPAGLADLLIRSQRLDECGVTQLYRFAAGRAERPGDAPLLQALLARFRGGKHRFDELLLDLVALPTFRHRVMEQP